MSGIPSWAVRGTKVVCVLPVPAVNLPVGVVAPEVGNVYTIREIITEDGEAYLLLVGIVNAVQDFADGTREPAFHVEGFRPLVTIEDDISTHFSALLDVRAPQLEDAT